MAVALVAVLLVMVWRAPTHRPGRHPRPDPRRCPGQPVRPVLPGPARRGGGLRRLPLLPELQRGRLVHHRRLHPVGPLDPVRRAPDVSELRVTVPASLEGVRVDRAVALLADVSRSAVDALVADGRVRGRRPGRDAAGARPSTRGRRSWSTAPTSAGPEGPVGDPSVEVVVVHEDADVIVVDKPAGLVVHPGAGHRTGTLVHGLLARYPELSDAARRGRVRARPPGDRPPARPGHLGPDGRGPHARRLPVPGRPAVGPGGVAHLPGPRARDGGGRLRTGGRPHRPVGELADPHGHLRARARRPAPATRWSAASRRRRPPPWCGRRGDGPDPPDPRPPGGHRPPGGGRRALQPGPVPARGHRHPAVPPRLRPGLRPPDDRGADVVDLGAARRPGARSWRPWGSETAGRTHSARHRPRRVVRTRVGGPRLGPCGARPAGDFDYEAGGRTTPRCGAPIPGSRPRDPAGDR